MSAWRLEFRNLPPDWGPRKLPEPATLARIYLAKTHTKASEAGTGPKQFQHSDETTHRRKGSVLHLWSAA
jgi:hypothetical protein